MLWILFIKREGKVVKVEMTEAKEGNVFQTALKAGFFSKGDYYLGHLRKNHVELGAKSIYVPYYNSDMTEGRGPMIASKFAFTSEQEANAYIDAQSGVMGRTAKWSQEKFGDWQIREFPIVNQADLTEKAQREAALAKLTPHERKLLKL